MSRRIRVLFVIDVLEISGAERQLALLASHLDQELFEPAVLFYYPTHNRLQAFLEQAGVKVVCVQRSGRNYRFLMNLVRFVREFQPDIVHTYKPTPGIWGRIAAVICGVRVLVHGERNMYLQKPLFTRVAERVLTLFTDRIICNTWAIKPFLAKQIWVSHDRISVVPNGFDLTQLFYRPETRVAQRRQWEVDDGTILFGMVARIAPQKNHLGLIRALAEVVRLGATNFRVAIVGADVHGMRESLEEEAAILGVKDYLIWAGYTATANEIYSAFDWLVLPSLFEGFPNVVVESFASGVPAIVSEVADNRRLVEGCGLVAPPGDDRLFGDAMYRAICTSAEEREQMRDRGLIRSQEYSLDTMVKATQDIYQELVALRGLSQ